MNKTATAQQPKTTSLLPPVQGLLQRQCACGNRTNVDGECTECAKKKHNLQRKLSIGASNDPLEHEADSVADQVMSMQPNATANKAPVRIQRYSGQTSQGEGTAPASVDHVLSSAGRPLEPSLRNDMEQRFGHDFSHVRLHTGGTAEQSAKDVNANAYTVGNNVVFGAGQFAPQTQSGQRLLAHELTHVVQQEASPSSSTHSNTASVQNKSTINFSNVFLRRDGIVDKVRSAIDPATRQFLSDLKDSVKQSPEHFVEFFTGELLETVKAHWIKIAAVTLGLLGTQLIIGGLEAAPTGITQIIGAILELAVLAVLGYFAIVEVVGAAEEGMRWWNIARKANGDPKEIAEASKAFVKMVWHIFMAILAVAGVRARIQAGAIPRVTAPVRGAPVIETPPVSPPPQLRPIQGGRSGQVKIEGGRVVSSGAKSSPPAGIRGPVASSGDATARAFQPEPEPIPEVPSPVREVPPLPKETGNPSISPAKPEATSPVKAAAVSASGGLVSSSPTSKPDLDSDLDKPSKRRGCIYESVGQQFGRYPCHAAYATHLSGVSREFRITSPDGESVDFDAMDHGQTLYEVKTGYRGVVFSKDPIYQNSIASAFWMQAERQMHVASSCRHKLKWYFNDPYAASFFGAKNAPYPQYFHAPMPVEVWYEPFDCDVDG